MSGRQRRPEPAPPRARRRPALYWLALLLGLGLLGGGGILWRQRASTPEAGAIGLPAAPDPEVQGMEAPVRELLAQARRSVLAQPGSAEAWGWYAAVLDAHHFYPEAEPCYRRAHALAPDDSRFSYNLAILLESLGAPPEESLALYRRVAAREPQFPPVHARIAYDLARKGELQAAVAAYQRALALDPKLWIARRSLGRLWIELEDLVQAKAELERVAAAAPDDGPTQAALAQAYTAAGDDVRAAAASKRARELPDTLKMPDPLRFLVLQQGSSAKLASERAEGRAAEGDWAGVVGDLKLVLRTRAHDPKIHERLAIAYEHLGQKALAEQEHGEARRLSREH